MTPPLGDYERKHDFAATPEPAGITPDPHPGDLPRFVVQEHSARWLHWDLRLERDEVEFTEWTAKRMLRHPVFNGLRADKDAREVVFEPPTAQP